MFVNYRIASFYVKKCHISCQESPTSDLNHPAHPTLEGLSCMGLSPMAPGPGPPRSLGLWAHEAQAHGAHGPIGPGPLGPKAQWLGLGPTGPMGSLARAHGTQWLMKPMVLRPMGPWAHGPRSMGPRRPWGPGPWGPGPLCPWPYLYGLVFVCLDLYLDVWNCIGMS